LSIATTDSRNSQLHTLGLWLFLAALGMLFASSMLAYVIVRIRAGAAGAGDLHLPGLLWASTAIILASSVSMHWALASLQRQRQKLFRRMLLATLGLGLLFVAVQVPAMAALLRAHDSLRAQNLHVYGLVFFLVLLHALHVVGGIAGLLRVNILALLGRLDRQHDGPVRHIAMYWHFLDIVWLVMFGIMLIMP
jgi:cytochrome c oxidase subunit III